VGEGNVAIRERERLNGSHRGTCYRFSACYVPAPRPWVGPVRMDAAPP
jgi:hypothetical protein